MTSHLGAIQAEAPTATEITDHKFEPRGEWWSLCKHCGLGRACHLAGATVEPPYHQPPVDRPTDEGQGEPERDEELPVGTGTEVNMLDAQMHVTGEVCDVCGGAMRRTGACLTCESCGHNTGCG